MKSPATSFLRIFSPVLLAGLVSHPALGEPSEEFPDNTLAGIYELAVQDDLTLEQARAQYRVGREERKLALAGLLPRVNASYGISESDSESRGSFPVGGTSFPNVTDRETDTDSWDVSLQQPIFDLPAWFQFKQGEQLSKQAEASLAVEQQNLVLRTVNAYFAVLRASANLKASRAQEDALRGQFDQVKQRFDVGLVAITDVHEAEAAFDLSVAQRITDEGQLDISREQLSVLTGRPHHRLWPLKEDFPVLQPDPASPKEWVDFARENNLDIEVALHGREAAQRGMQAARSRHLPRVDLSYRYSDSQSDITQTDVIQNTTASFPNDGNQSVIALSLSVPIYTGGATSSARRQAAARHETQVAFYEGTIRQVTQETRAFFTRVASDVSRIRARQRAVTSAESALEAAELGYEVGTRNVVDVLNAQQAYYSAIRDYDNSILDYVISLTQLKRLAGTLGPQDIYELNNWLMPPNGE